MSSHICHSQRISLSKVEIIYSQARQRWMINKISNQYEFIPLFLFNQDGSK